ncbi:MAG: OsmC family protein [Rhodothermia bacterium]|nr:MAG: OsmC family protein [Rhodothermia bacterium]
MKRKASAEWTGSLKEGRGTMSAASGVLKDTQYSFKTRFEEGIGTNPEELIGAAHAGCYSMALSAELGNAGFDPQSVRTTATVTLEMLDDGPTVTSVHLVAVANVPGADDESFQAVAIGAKEGCPISRLLDTEITLDARLEG